MRFTPKTEDEIQMAQLLSKGEYMFSVKYAENATSKKGNEMIKLTVSIWDVEGKGYMLYDYLLESMASKLRHFCDAAGILDKYQSGTLEADDCINKEGVLLIDVEQNDSFPARNIIKDYIKTDKPKKEGRKKKDGEILSDDIPF